MPVPHYHSCGTTWLNRDEQRMYSEDSAVDDTMAAGDVPIGLFYTWWRGDLLPRLRPVDGLTVERSDDTRFVTAMTGSDLTSIRERIGQGQWPWIARIEEQPVGWGWVATQAASIGELDIRLAIPPENRYLWDFVTVAAWRGRGVYAHLLQTIVRANRDANRFWVGHDTPNVASGRGIVRAGFQGVGRVHRLSTETLAFVPDGLSQRAEAAAALLGLPLVDRSTGNERETRQTGA